MMETSKTHPTSTGLPRPLEGVRILDLTVALAGPYCSLLLGGLGAEVIKIEGPGAGEIARNNPPFFGKNGVHLGAIQEGDISATILTRGRNKESITLDLKSDRGREIFMRLARLSDVVLENLSDGTAERLGVGYAAVREANPKIIYGSISGLGEGHPYPGMKAMDIIVQALSGAMDVTGFEDGPPMRFGLPIADLLAPLFMTSGILSGLIQRGRTGTGQHVKVSMLDCLASLLPIEHFDLFQRFGLPPRSGNHHNRLCPFGIFVTRNGHVAIAAVADDWLRGLLDAMSQPELLADPRFNGRGPRTTNANALNALIEAWTRQHTTDEIVTELYAKRGVPCAPVRTVAEVLADPRLHATGALQPLSHPRFGPIDAVGMGLPISFSGSQAGFERPARELGASNDAVYGDLLGLSESEIGDLKAHNII